MGHTPNKEQAQVINEQERNILLLASAGTGKTGTLAKRVAKILADEKASSEEILCLTFTNKASREIKQAIQSEVGKLANGINIGTFHSFCFKILQEESKALDTFYQEMTIFDEEETQSLLDDILKKENEFNISNYEVRQLSYIIAYIKEQRALRDNYSSDIEYDYRVTIDEIMADDDEKEKVESLFSDKSGFRKDLLSFFANQGYEYIAEYQKELRDNHAVDFTDLIVEVNSLFKNEKIKQRWENRFKYICIDEVQDTSILEYKVLKNLWGDNKILLSGDFFQTIYEWRGSAPVKILKDFKEKYNPLCIAFYHNYRSTQTIFEASLAVLEKLFPNEIWKFYDKKPSAYSSDFGAKIKIHEAESQYDEAKYIFKMIDQITDEETTNCVLVRNNYTAQKLAKFFEKFNERLPRERRKNFLLVDQFNFYRRMEIKDIMAYLKLAVNPHDVQSAKRIIKRFVKSIGPVKLASLESQECQKTGLRLPDFLNLQIFEEDPYEQLEQGLKEDNIIVYDVESTGIDTTSDEIIQIAAIRINAKGEVLEKFERFIKPNKKVGQSEDVHGFSDAYLAENGEDAKTVLEAFLEFSKSAVIVGHNVQYDVNIFTSELARHNLGRPKFKAVYDTLDIYRRFHPNEKNHKLEYLSKVYETNHKPSHNAMDDILATAELLIKAVDNDIRPTYEMRRVFIVKNKGAFAQTAANITTLRRKSKTEMPSELLVYIMNNLGLADFYRNLDELGAKRAEDKQRLNNLRELYNIFKEHEAEYIKNSKKDVDLLQLLLRNATLQSSEFSLRNGAKQIPIITVHQSKGSEFDNVFLAGMQEGTFPTKRAVREEKLKEENRLFYVALTRAKSFLSISYVNDGRNKRSFYLDLIPKMYIEE